MPRRSQRPIRSHLPATLARSGITGLRDVTALSQQLIMMAAAARQSRFGGGEGDPMPPPEYMFKAAKDGPVNSRLQAFLRSRGFPEWFTVAVGPKGSYREYDVIEFLQRHLESWRDDREWRIMLCDDYSVNTSQNMLKKWCVRMLKSLEGHQPLALTPSIAFVRRLDLVYQ